RFLRVKLSLDAARVARPPALSLHDALPISRSRRPRARSCATSARAAHEQRARERAPRRARAPRRRAPRRRAARRPAAAREDDHADRKSTRLNSSHVKTSYAVFCLKKKTKQL